MKHTIGRSLAAAGLSVFAIAAEAAGQRSVVAEGPTGWFGVTLSDEGMLDERGTTFFDNYPIVRAVEPFSPAAKAGVMPGDILMSFNSHDMRGSVFQLKNWLKPGAPFVLQLKRNDDVRVVRGILGRAPKGWEERVVINVRPSPFEERTHRPTRSATRSQKVTVRTPLPGRVPPALIPNFTFGPGLYPFAGMEFTALNEDIRDVLGVKPEGVFVTNVVEGSPARISGLRGGDVLVRADGFKLATPVDLVQAISEARDQTLSLRIIRKRKQQNLTLRW
ncbi:MAG TPA: PDZ domain-containing protein [Gemmatimonadaceae bacterium]|nr:PDZ domain-containing protein [Gemmatimonadaceae bacterium]